MSNRTPRLGVTHPAWQPAPRFPSRRVTLEELIGPLTDIERRYAPSVLFVSGTLTLPLRHPRVSIVGTRNPSEEGRRLAEELGSTLGKQGAFIVSGLARGIDTAAHQSTIAAGGKTVAVLGTPLSRTYPRENAPLQYEIMRSHLAVSQFSDSHKTEGKDFVLRDRTMALISDVSVIVESGDSGGSLYQGWEAIRLGRPLFVHSRVFKVPGLDWPHKMATYGAIEFREPDDILDYLPSPSLNLATLALGTA